MFNRLPIDVIRQVLGHLTISDTWSLFQAHRAKQTKFSRAIRSLCGSNHKHTYIKFGCCCLLAPARSVETKIQVRKDHICLSGVCPHCRTKKTDHISSITCFQRRMTSQQPCMPCYVAPTTILIGYYNMIPEEELVIGNLVDVLYHHVWHSARISSISREKIQTTLLKRENYNEDIHTVVEWGSPHIAKHGSRIRDWSLTVGSKIDCNYCEGVIVATDGETFIIDYKDYYGSIHRTRVVYNGKNIVRRSLNSRYDKPRKNSYKMTHHLLHTVWDKDGQFAVYMDSTTGHIYTE